MKSARCLFNFAFRFLFQVLAFEIFHLIFDRSIVINKPFLVHVFKLQRFESLRFLLKSEICQPHENHLVTAHTSKDMIRGT